MPDGAPNIPDPGTVDRSHADVIGLYDSEDGVPTFVIADLTAEDRWLAVPTDASLALEDWQ